MRFLAMLLVLLTVYSCACIERVYADAEVSDLIIYEVFVRNFSPEGTLKAVEARLDELHALGINALWLMPIHPIGEVKRKGTVGSPYSVRDYRSIDPALGSIDDLRALVDEAHVRGMKVLMDIVPNHSAWDHSFVEAHPDWYRTDENGQLRPPIPDWSDVVQFDYDHEALFAEMREIMHFWPATCGIDGYRVDAAGMIPDRFWQDVIPDLKKAYPGFIMLAEATGARFHRLGFDLSYDQPLRDIMRRVAQGERRAVEIQNYLRQAQEDYPPHAKLMRYTENHDVDRARAVFPRTSHRVAAAAAFTLPGTPMLFAGQEVGIDHRPELFERDPVPWEMADDKILKFYEELIALRKGSDVLRRGTWRDVHNSMGRRVVTYFREYQGESLLIVLNFRNGPASSLLISGVAEGFADDQLKDLLSNERMEYEVDMVNGTITLDVPSYGILILEPDED